MKLKILLSWVALTASSLLYGQKTEMAIEFNPLIPDFLADPSLVMFNDTFYLYGTTDIDRGLGEMGPPVVWKSDDFVNWQFEGVIMPQIDWNKKHEFTNEKGEKKSGFFRYWAPGKPLFRDGRYYLFPTIVAPDEKLGTYVVVAERPEGPFRFLKGEGISFNDTINPVRQAAPLIGDIDGEPFVDNDGQAYIFWRRRFGAKMSSNFDQLVSEPVSIKTNYSGYSEGPLLFRRNDIYYYVYTLSGHSNYCNGYMMSRKGPLGPFEAPQGKSIFIHTSVENNVWGPGHGNVFQMPGSDDFYFLYLEYGEGGTTRQVFANKMSFNADGTICPIIPDRVGVGPLGTLKEKRINIATQSAVSASSTRPSREVKAQVITDPNAVKTLQVNTREGEWRTRSIDFQPWHVTDGSNRTRWMAGEEDVCPWIMVDLKKIKTVSECRFFFTFPTFGHQWLLETSTDGNHWTKAGEETTQAIRSPHVVKNIGDTRFLRLTILKGSPGVWEFQVF